MSEKESAAKDFLASRANAYKRVFPLDNKDVEFVLKDLMKFCRAIESTYATDPRDAARLDGRREVFLRIQSHTKMSQDQLWALLGVPPPKG